MKNIPNIPATMSAWTTFAPETLRERKMRSGTSGRLAVAWRATKPASRAIAAAPKPSVCAEPQPWSTVPTIV